MFVSQCISYNQTNAFTKIALDYLNTSENLRPFYDTPPTVSGIGEVIKKKERQVINRNILAEVMQQQYETVKTTEKVKANIELLLLPETFTITTAHQPNLFTGPLYFVYKILHAIKLAETLKKELPAYNFVPVYYMGAEDADFQELNHTYVEGKKLEWKKQQKGAVGRMQVDESLIRLIEELEGQLIHQIHGKEIIELLRRCYSTGKNIQTATFELVNELYGAYGLLVLIPDHPLFKAQMQSVFEQDLFQNTSAEIVQQTSKRLEQQYNVQAHPREINLFYLKEDIRERIVRKGDAFFVNNTDISFTEDSIKLELKQYPERFSPNVILRGLYQETILPNIVFIGGGGEMAYWLQLKDLFHHYNVVYPVLVLRNSFLIVEAKWKERIQKMGFAISDFFQTESELMNQVVAKHSTNSTALNGTMEKAAELFEQIRQQAESIDLTLSAHVAALKTRSLKTLQELEKKMLRAEKRKFSDQERQIQSIKAALFPGNGLQERKENFSGFYAKWGRSFIEELYRTSLSLEQEFTLLYEK